MKMQKVHFVDNEIELRTGLTYDACSPLPAHFVCITDLSCMQLFYEYCTTVKLVVSLILFFYII